MDAAAELGRNPVSKHQIQPEDGDEQADAGRDGWTRLARPKSQARTGTGEYCFAFLCVSGQRGTIAKSMYEEHLCVVALTSIERGTQFFPLVSYFLVWPPTALLLPPGE